MLVQEAARQWFITQEARTVYNTLVPFTTAAAAVVYSLMASVTRTNENEQKRWQTLIYMLNPVSGGYEATYHSCLSDSAVVQLNSWRCPWKSRTNFIRPLYAPIRNSIIIVFPFAGLQSSDHTSSSDSHRGHSPCSPANWIFVQLASLTNGFLKSTQVSRFDFWFVLLHP